MRKAFTLVELIIVITILVILATIGFLNFGNYGAEARDTVRISDFKNIEKALELYKIENGEYPEPDELTEEEKQKYINEKKFIGFTEGKIGENLGAKLKFGQVPKDPSDKSYYRYSVSEDGKIYLMKLELETQKQKIVGDIPINCKSLKEKNNFRGNGVYTVFHENIEPREVYCHENYDETFQLSVIGGDMEKILGNNDNNQKYATFYEGDFGSRTTTNFVTDKKHSGERSLKVEGNENISRSDFIYIDPNKKYKMSGWFKIKRKDSNINLPSEVFLGLKVYSLVNGEIKEIPGKTKNAVVGTETKLARNLNINDKKIYFECNEKIYKNWLNKLGPFDMIAFEVDESGELKDLPNYNLSNQIGEWGDIRYNYTHGFLQVEGGANWGANKEEIKTCILNSHFAFGKNYTAGTFIRKHKAWGNVHEIRKYFPFDEWVYFEGTFGKNSDKNFTKFDNFAKFYIIGNYNSRIVDGKRKYINENTITYMDDIKFEIIE